MISDVVAEVETQSGGRGSIVAAVKHRTDKELSWALENGIVHLGENRVQEHKNRTLLPTQAVWHFIGRIQTNKAKLIAQGFSWVHSLFRLKEAAALVKSEPPYPYTLIEVNLGESSKGGLSPEELPAFVDSVRDQYPELPLKGLMAMPPPTKNPETNRASFAHLRQLGDALFDAPVLSMGTSQDWQIALQEGSTFVRLGTALFGDRNG